MSGHSKWHNIKIRKSKVDVQRSKFFTKISREIILAVKSGGPDPEANIGLKNALMRARDVNMPNDNIRKVIERASGSGETQSLEEVSYEGYGPAGVAVLVEVATDNRNRSAADVRHIFSRFGGNMGENGCVSWMFSKKGLITLPPGKMSEDDLMVLALEAGAEDLKPLEEGGFEIITDPLALGEVRRYLEEHGLAFEGAEITRIPQTLVPLAGEEATRTIKLLEALEEHDDVQNVYANFDIPEEILEKIS